jgi:hypothetical protein
VERSRSVRGFAGWFYAAAAYNLAWGAAVVVYPDPLAELGGLGGETVLVRVIGLFVLVYAPAYWWAARRPEAHAHLVAVALLGKLGGTIGFLAAASVEALPLAFGLVVVCNDAVWLPAFALYLRRASRLAGGWRALLAG